MCSKYRSTPHHPRKPVVIPILGHKGEVKMYEEATLLAQRTNAEPCGVYRKKNWLLLRNCPAKEVWRSQGRCFPPLPSFHPLLTSHFFLESNSLTRQTRGSTQPDQLQSGPELSGSVCSWLGLGNKQWPKVFLESEKRAYLEVFCAYSWLYAQT